MSLVCVRVDLAGIGGAATVKLLAPAQSCGSLLRCNTNCLVGPLLSSMSRRPSPSQSLALVNIPAGTARSVGVDDHEPLHLAPISVKQPLLKPCASTLP